jgi:hypothetical protein
VRTTDWAISVEFDAESPLTADELDELSDLADETHTTVARRSGGGYVVLTTREADDPYRAAADVTRLGIWWATELGIKARLLGASMLTSEEAAMRAQAPTIPALASAADAAHILGVSRQRVHQLSKQHPRFPPAIAHVAVGPLWTVDAIRWFGSVWERRSGRPPKAP